LCETAIITILTYLLTPWCRVLLEKLTGLQLVTKFPAFHGTRRFITALTSVRHLSLSWASSVQSIYTHPTRLDSQPNIIHPSMPRSPQWSLALRFPHQDPIQPSLLTHTCHMPSPAISSRFYHLHNIELRSTAHLAPHHAIASIPPLPHPSTVQIFSSTPYSQTSSASFPPTMSATKFHTHTKQQAKATITIMHINVKHFRIIICSKQVGWGSEK